MTYDVLHTVSFLACCADMLMAHHGAAAQGAVRVRLSLDGMHTALRHWLCVACSSRTVPALPHSVLATGPQTRALLTPRQATDLPALPADVQRDIMMRSWAARLARSTAEEVRHAAELHGMCYALRAPPFELKLDFSRTVFTHDQYEWLVQLVRIGYNGERRVSGGQALLLGRWLRGFFCAARPHPALAEGRVPYPGCSRAAQVS